MRLRNTLLCVFILWHIGVDGRYRPIDTRATYEGCKQAAGQHNDWRVLCLPGTINPNH
jgi:hypothetical protein